MPTIKPEKMTDVGLKVLKTLIQLNREVRFMAIDDAEVSTSKVRVKKKRVVRSPNFTEHFLFFLCLFFFFSSIFFQ